jgi:hypothetical protein
MLCQPIYALGAVTCMPTSTIAVASCSPTHPAGHEAGEEHVEVYRESLTPEGKLVYTLPLEAGLMPAPTGLHGTSLLAPYQRLEVGVAA